MGTVIRAEISKKNPYYISKHRYYELKHFCLQYPEWKDICSVLESDYGVRSPSANNYFGCGEFSDVVGNTAVRLVSLKEKLKMVEDTAVMSDPILAKYILKAVTDGVSFNYLKTVMNMPCEKDMYYNRYRKFFWLLSKKMHQL